MTRKLLPLVPDAADALGGIGRTKLYDLIGSGELETVKIGRRRFVPAEAIESYVAGLEGPKVQRSRKSERRAPLSTSAETRLRELIAELDSEGNASIANRVFLAMSGR